MSNPCPLRNVTENVLDHVITFDPVFFVLACANYLIRKDQRELACLMVIAIRFIYAKYWKLSDKSNMIFF